MPTFLDYYRRAPAALPAWRLPFARPSKPTRRSTTRSSTATSGWPLNVTDGQYTYFRNPVNAESLIHAYTAMPTGFHGFLSRESLAEAEMGRFLGHTYNIPVYKIPMKGQPAHRHGGGEKEAYQPVHDVYNIVADPDQQSVLTDPATEARLLGSLQEHLRRVEAPEEHFARLGVES